MTTNLPVCHPLTALPPYSGRLSARQPSVKEIRTLPGGEYTTFPCHAYNKNQIAIGPVVNAFAT